MSDTVFSSGLIATRSAFRFSTPVATRPVFAGLVQRLHTIDAHDAIEQATVWASLAGGGFFVAAMVGSMF